ncbi:MAG: hypothetical protein VR73_09120 [Gammaproteobacteria bacterium BRH_c0]|nr:MAG: hypothetical protein VR73_09120 [Gammaproteobacteria bacterium BRH_c0]
MDFSLGKTLSLLIKTAPFIALRLVIFFGITLAYVVGTGGGAGIGYLVGKAGGDPAGTAFWGAFGGFGLVSGILYLLREYLLYLVKAGHIAVLVQLIDDKPIPGGRSQIDYAAAEVKARFAESSTLFAIDQLIKGVLKAINGLLLSIGRFVPIPGLEPLLRFVSSVLNLSLTYVDEVILAHNIRTHSDNPWESSRNALVLYAQNYGKMVKNALFLAFIVWIFTFVLFLLVLAPVAALVTLFPGIAGFWTVVIAIVVAISLKAAIVDPLAMAALLQAYFRVTEGQQPNPEWVQKLEGVSDKFRKLGEKARSFVPGKSTPVEPAAPTPNDPA